MDRVTKISKTGIVVESAAPKVVPKQKRTLPVVFVLVILLLLSLGIAGYFYYQYKHTAQVAQAEEIVSLTKTIGAVMELSTDETPTLATVTDKEKLADQPFFRKAENGDKVLIYTNSGRAILYRPSTKKIIDVTSVNVNPQTGQNTSSTPASSAPASEISQNQGATPDTLKVALYNGSGEAGVTNLVEKELMSAYPKATVTTKQTAVSSYDNTLAIDLTGKNKTLVESLSFAVKGKVASLPDGEQKPDGTDVLVIVGKNR